MRFMFSSNQRSVHNESCWCILSWALFRMLCVLETFITLMLCSQWQNVLSLRLWEVSIKCIINFDQNRVFLSFNIILQQTDTINECVILDYILYYNNRCTIIGCSFAKEDKTVLHNEKKKAVSLCWQNKFFKICRIYFETLFVIETKTADSAR